MFSKVHICDAKIAYLDDIANLKCYFMVCTFQESCKLLKLSKMFIGNICNWLFKVMMPLPESKHIAKSLQDESGRGLISCTGKFFKPLDNIRKVASLAKTALYFLPDVVVFSIFLSCYSHIALYVTNFR